ncbi:MAG: BACON domain-containing protein [Bacteroidaceae bacterium]|nr:BACON domain-containing protein [Bacteroidaceae bacterium]
MKTLRYIHILVLTLLGAINTVAQTIEDGEAFYIYRNDGDFDGFFCDQVQEIRYSKLDLDSVEWTEYVVQEVVTADSIYRIPLAAIDSVGFVQPEIKFNPKVRHMDMLGMSQYVIAVDSMTLLFSNNLPQSLMPHEGDVLLGFTGVLEQEGFGGRANRIIPSEYGIIVTCDQLEQISDIFDQFISVEMVEGVPGSSASVRHVAGYDMLVKASGGHTGKLLDFNMNGHIPVIPHDGAGSYFDIDLGANLQVKLCGIYQIHDNKIFIKLRTIQDFGLTVGASFSIKGTGSKSLAEVTGMRPNILFPAACPIFSIRPIPDLAVNWTGEFKAKVTFPTKRGRLIQNFVIDSESSSFIQYTGSESSWGDNKEGIFDDTQADLQFNGNLQIGIKSQLGIFTANWLSKIFNLGISTDVLVGPKLDGSVNFSLTNALSGNGVYTLKDSYVALIPLSLDYESRGDASVFFKKKNWSYTFAEGNFKLLPSLELFMLPNFEDMTASYDPATHKLTAGWKTDRRRVFWPSQVGIGVYPVKGANHPDLRYTQYDKKLSFAALSPDSFNIDYNTKDLTPGVYYVAPLVSALGMESPIQSMRQRFIVPGASTLSANNLKVKGEGGTYQVTVDKSEESTLYCSKAYDYLEDWFNALVTDNNTITLEVQRNPSFFERKDSVSVWTTVREEDIEGEAGEEIIEDETTLYFTQEPTVMPSDLVEARVSIGIPYIDSNGDECMYDEGIILVKGENANFTWSGNKLTIKASNLQNTNIPSREPYRPAIYGDDNYYGPCPPEEATVDKKSVEIVLDLVGPDSTIMRKLHIDGEATVDYHCTGNINATPDDEGWNSFYKSNWNLVHYYHNHYEFSAENIPGRYEPDAYYCNFDFSTENPYDHSGFWIAPETSEMWNRYIKKLSCSTTNRWKEYIYHQYAGFEWDPGTMQYTNIQWSSIMVDTDEEGDEYSSFSRFDKTKRPNVSVFLYPSKRRAE